MNSLSLGNTPNFTPDSSLNSCPDPWKAFLSLLAKTPRIKPEEARPHHARWVGLWLQSDGDRSADVSTTMTYLHVIKRAGAGTPSPLDLG